MAAPDMLPLDSRLQVHEPELEICLVVLPCQGAAFRRDEGRHTSAIAKPTFVAPFSMLCRPNVLPRRTTKWSSVKDDESTVVLEIAAAINAKPCNAVPHVEIADANILIIQ